MPKLGDLLPARERIMEGRGGPGSLLAQQVATLDRLAEGRLILGIGIATDVPNIRAELDADAGFTHMCLRLAGDPGSQRESVARTSAERGW
jgi:hypothetical protein